MNDLNNIEKPLILCTKEQQERLKALVGVEGALQRLSRNGHWISRPAPLSLKPHLTYRQNPDWRAPTLDVPNWFWDNTKFNFVAMDENREVYAFKSEPSVSTCNAPVWVETVDEEILRLDKLFACHNFNPHNVPWYRSLTVRPGL